MSPVPFSSIIFYYFNDVGRNRYEQSRWMSNDIYPGVQLPWQNTAGNVSGIYFQCLFWIPYTPNTHPQNVTLSPVRVESRSHYHRQPGFFRINLSLLLTQPSFLPSFSLTLSDCLSWLISSTFFCCSASQGVTLHPHWGKKQESLFWWRWTLTLPATESL